MKTCCSVLFWIVSLAAFAAEAPAPAVTLPAIPRALRWENAPASFATPGQDLRLAAGAKTNLFRHPNGLYSWDSAPMLLFVPDGDFVFSACVEHAFANKWDAGGLVLRSDGLNWIKFCFEKDYAGAHRVISVVTKGVSDDCNSIEFPGNRVFLKIARSDNQIMLYCSADGHGWSLIRHLRFESKAPVEVGFLSQSPVGQSCETSFTQIEYRAVKIKDAYAGE